MATSPGFSGAITGLAPSTYSSSSLSGNALDVYDNLFYPSGTAPSVLGYNPGELLDYGGLDFLVAGGNSVNIFGQGTGSAYFIIDGNIGNTPATYDSGVPVSFTVSSVPEIDPATGVSAVALLAGTITILRGRRRTANLV